MTPYRNILITGGAGFVGSSLACAMRQDMPDVRVVALDNLMRRGSELNLPRLRAAGVDFQHADIRNPDDLQTLGEFDLLIDCAAEPSVQAGVNGSPRPVLDTNLTVHPGLSLIQILSAQSIVWKPRERPTQRSCF